jgi:hypothetical protein
VEELGLLPGTEEKEEAGEGDALEAEEDPEEEEVEEERRKEAIVRSRLEMMRGSFFLMSISKTMVVTVVGLFVKELEYAVRMVIGKPEDFFDQIKAILAPRPNLPLVCLMPCLLPDKTRPKRSPTWSGWMPLPLSMHWMS